MKKLQRFKLSKFLNNNTEEAIFYYENNWKKLREKAVERDYIHSFQLLETTFTDETQFHLMLITTYTNTSQFELREVNFGKLIEERGDLYLLNDKSPPDFRKTVFVIEAARSL